MELTKNQKIVGVSLAGVVAWLLYRKKVKLQSHRAEAPSGPVQVVVPVATGAGTGPIANVLGNILPSAHVELVHKALSQTPLVIQAGKMSPTRISTIADVQHALNFLKVCGNTSIRDSGVLDPPTVACIKAFQNVMQLPITGMDDPTTKMALETAITKAAISSAAPAVMSHPSVVSPPAVNPTIQTERDLQRALNLLGSSPKLKEDGKIGPITTAAIKAFQVVHGLTADGLAGPQTKAAIAVAVQTPATTDPTASQTIASVANAAAQAVAHGDFGYGEPPPPPPPTHPGMPGFMGAGGGYVPPPPPPNFQHRPGEPDFRRPEYHHPGFIPGPLQNADGSLYARDTPAPPGWHSADGTPWMKSWDRWQQAHAGRPDNTWTHYTQWRDGVGKQPNAVINGEFGDFGFNRAAAMMHRPAPPGMRGGFRRHGGFEYGIPVDEEIVVDETVVEDGDPVEFNGEQIREMEEHAIRNAHQEAVGAFARGDRRFERHEVGPGAPPMRGENAYHPRVDEHRFGERRFGERRGWFDRIRGWWSGERRNVVDENPYIPPPATPAIVNWDPFAVDVAPAVDRWHPDDLRRHEELERRGFRPEPPIVPGRPAPPIVDHPTPPAPPAPAVGRPPPPPPPAPRS